MAKSKVLSEREQEILSFATAGNSSELAATFQKGTHHGKPGANQAEKRLAGRTIQSVFQQDQSRLISLTRELADAPSASAREVACALLQDLLVQEVQKETDTPREVAKISLQDIQSQELLFEEKACVERERADASDSSLLDLLLRLAMDKDWEVREWSAPVFTALLSTDFPSNVPLIRHLLDHSHESVRRQIALAIKQTAQLRIPDSVHTLLELIEPLMADESEYVRQNLGPFALGDGVLKVYPSETLTAFRTWLHHEEWPVRWNIAMSFSAAQGSHHLEAAWELLSMLTNDPHKQVQSAVKKACKNILKKSPEAIRFATLL